MDLQGRTFLRYLELTVPSFLRYFAVILISISCGVAESRCHESAKIRAKYPDRIPVSVVT